MTVRCLVVSVLLTLGMAREACMRFVSLLALVSLGWAASAQAAGVALVGFETGSAVDHAGLVGTASYSTTTVRTGTYALRANPTTTATGHGHIISQGVNQATNLGLLASWDLADVYIEFQFRAATFPSSGTSEPIFQCATQASALKLEIRATNTAGTVTLTAYDSTGTNLLASGSTALSTGTWYRIGIRCGTGASGNYAVSIDGSSEFSGTGDLTTTNSARAFLGKPTNRSGESVDFFYDDVWVDNAALKGNIEIRIGVPNANGSTMSYAAGTGASDYQEVDEIPHSDADYVESASGGVALMDMQDASTIGATGTIQAVLGIARIREGGSAGAGSMVLRIRSGSTNSDSNANDPSTTVLNKVRLLETDPDTAAAWTSSGVDGVEVGINEANAVSARMTATYVFVASTPAAGGGGRAWPCNRRLLGVGRC